jgi:proto-chlorophyllide reductase subunit
MKFLCIDCDSQMQFEDRAQPGDGTFAAAFACPTCGRRIALLANPMETQLVGSLGVKIGGRTLDEQPMELARSAIAGRDDAFRDATEADTAPRRPRWTADSEERLARVPGFVRGMVKKIYRDYAVEHGIDEITPAVMDRARTELGLEGM